MPLDTTVKYLVQHSETGEYLYPVSGGLSVYTRALSISEKDSPTYQWTLDRKSDGYLIKSVAESKLLVAGTPDASNVIPAVLEAPSTASERLKWTLSSEEVDKAVQLSLKSMGTIFYLYKISGKNVSISSTQTAFWGHHSWVLVLAVPPKAVVPSLIPMKNPLPDGSYTIRAFNGPYLLTAPNNTQSKHQDRNIYVSKRQSDIILAKYQRWEVTLIKDTGLYSIKNSETGFYLGPTGDHWLQGDFLVGLDKPFSNWTIQTTDMGVMFFIGLIGLRSLSIGFPDYEGGDLSEVELEPSDSVPSQIWFFRSLEVNPTAPSQNIIHSISILDAKDYYIRSCHDNKIYLGVTNDEVKLGDTTSKSKFTLAYPDDNSGGFTLSCIEKDDNDNDEVNYFTNTKGRLQLWDENPTIWVAIPRKSQNGTVYHICDTATGPKAISSRSIRKDKVAVDTMGETDEVQWWTFEAA